MQSLRDWCALPFVLIGYYSLALAGVIMQGNWRAFFDDLKSK